MYQNMQMNPNQGINPYYNYSGYPYNYPNYSMEQSKTVYPTNPINGYLKGRPVASLDEAKAAQIDFDGSLHVFTDIGNKKIYTKQINVDGTATLNTYSLVEENVKEIVEPLPEYVTKEEFNQALAQIQMLFNNQLLTREDEKKSLTLNSF